MSLPIALNQNTNSGQWYPTTNIFWERLISSRMGFTIWAQPDPAWKKAHLSLNFTFFGLLTVKDFPPSFIYRYRSNPQIRQLLNSSNSVQTKDRTMDYDESDSDDLQDPGFDAVEETQSLFSALSVEKKAKSRSVSLGVWCLILFLNEIWPYRCHIRVLFFKYC